jgi:drug/metabolite transporter (DMT)-like permease
MIISWLLVITFAYLFFALSAFGDKLILQGPPKPKSYTFYAGILSILAIFLIPFFGLSFPNIWLFLLIVLDAIIFILGMYFGYKAVEQFEVSKVATTIGAVQPIFIFFISWFFWGYQALSTSNLFAFLLLFTGSIFISFDKKPELTKQYLKLTLLAGLMYSLDYVLLKHIFSNFPFIQGYIWRSIFVALAATSLLIKKKNRAEIFKKRDILNGKLKKIFFATQTVGGIESILQSFAISLAPIAFLPIMNSMRGLQYVFLFVITSFFTIFFPKILKEKTSKKIIIRKIISIFLIVFGLIILVF